MWACAFVFHKVSLEIQMRKNLTILSNFFPHHFYFGMHLIHSTSLLVNTSLFVIYVAEEMPQTATVYLFIEALQITGV